MNSHQLRLKDFERRAAFDPASVYQHRTRGWRYIPVHPFADEISAKIFVVDCWCLLEGDAALLECAVCPATTGAAGFYACIDAGPPHWPKLHFATYDPLTRAAVEAAMEKFVELGFPELLLPRLRNGAALARLAP